MSFLKHYRYLSLLLLCPQFSLAQQATFTIKGNVSNAEIKTLYLTSGSFLNNVKPSVQKVEVLNGKFSVNGAFNEPIPVFLSLNQDYKQDPTGSKQFILDSGINTVLIRQNILDAQITGSKAQEDMQRLLVGQSPFQEKINQIGKEAELKSQLGIAGDSIAKLFRLPFRAANMDLLNYQRFFIKQNPRAFVSLLLVPNIAKSSFNFLEADSLLRSLSTDIQGSSTAKLVKDYIDSE